MAVFKVESSRVVIAGGTLLKTGGGSSFCSCLSDASDLEEEADPAAPAALAAVAAAVEEATTATTTTAVAMTIAAPMMIVFLCFLTDLPFL